MEREQFATRWRAGVRRPLGEGEEAHVTNMELYFDLVYVFAFTQLSQYLYEHLSVTGAVHTLILLLALWWAWNDTAWATGWVDPERPAVVVLMAALMAASVLAASAVLEAFGDRGLRFAGALVVMQLLRGGFMYFAFAPGDALRRHYRRLLGWALVSSILWIAGGSVHGSEARTELWLAAAIISLLAPAFRFWFPGLGATTSKDLMLAGGHLAERCQLLLMVAFGETILRLGEAVTETHASFSVFTTFMVGFTLTFSLSMIYFLRHAKAGQQALAGAGRHSAELGINGYTYSHTLLVAATVMVSVAIHEGIEHPGEHVSVGFAIVCIGAPIVYLLGIALWKLMLGHGRLLPLAVGVVALLAFGLPATLVSEAMTLGVVAIVVVVIAVWVQFDGDDGGLESLRFGS